MVEENVGLRTVAHTIFITTTAQIEGSYHKGRTSSLSDSRQQSRQKEKVEGGTENSDGRLISSCGCTTGR
jgi:hypothetical protein